MESYAENSRHFPGAVMDALNLHIIPIFFKNAK